MTHVMVDIETMGNRSKAAIVSIGAVKFDPSSEGLGDQFYCLVDLQSCLNAGLEVDASTIMWWLNQSPEAREALNPRDRWGISRRCFDLRDALTQLGEWFSAPSGVTYIWGHGATFDPVILSNAYWALGMRAPWSFRDVRDTRTLFDLSGPVPTEGLLIGDSDLVEHHALYDAKKQALMVQFAYKKLNVGAQLP